jgi:hypothetical protein
MDSPHAAEHAESSTSQRPLELILARNLLTSLSTPGFLIDSARAR